MESVLTHPGSFIKAIKIPQTCPQFGECKPAKTQLFIDSDGYVYTCGTRKVKILGRVVGSEYYSIVKK